MNIQDINFGQFEHHLLLAFLLGTIIGLERQWRHKIARVKTNALVSGGAALIDSVKASKILHLNSIKADGGDSIIARIHSLDRRQTDVDAITSELSMIKDIRSVKWEEIKNA